MEVLVFVKVETGRKRRKSPVGEVRGPRFLVSYSALASAANVVFDVSSLLRVRVVLTGID